MAKKPTRSYKIIDIDITKDPKFHTRDRYIVKADFIENNKKVHSIKHAFNIKTEEDEIKFYKWFIITNKKLVEYFKTSSDNGSWNKSIFFDNAFVKLPSKTEMENASKRYDELMKMRKDVLEFED